MTFIDNPLNCFLHMAAVAGSKTLKYSYKCRIVTSLSYLTLLLLIIMTLMRIIALKELLLGLYFVLGEEKTWMQSGLQMCQYSHYPSKDYSLHTDQKEFALHCTTLHYIITLIIMLCSALISVCDNRGP